MRIKKSFIVLVAMLLSPVAAHAYFISVDAKSAIRRCSGTFEQNFFAEIDGAVSAAVEANSGGCAGAASAFAEADLGARTVRTFNTSSTEGTSDAQAELFDTYFIMGVPEDILFVDLGIGLSFDGTVETDGHVFNSGRLLGGAGQFSVDISPLTIGGTFASGGIQRFPRLLGGGFPRIDILLLIDSIQFFGTGTADFSNTASVDFDLSLLPPGATLVSQSGFTIRQASAVPEPVTIDIKPGSDPNGVNPRSKGVIPVAVLGSMDFDATQVDFSAVLFGPGEASPVHDGHVENVNGDGFADMVFHFKGAGIACGDTDATLTGETFGGQLITGTDTVKTAGCK